MQEPAASPDRDTRGILDPAALLDRIGLTRQPVPRELEDFLDRFWGVEWDLPDGEHLDTQVLTHPGANIAIGRGEALGAPVGAFLYGVAREVSVRTLVGAGWTVSAMTRPGGLSPFVGGSVSALTDQKVPLGPALSLDEVALVEETCAASTQEARTAVLCEALLERLDRADPERLGGARRVTEVSRLAESDRSLSRVDDLAVAAGTSSRTLQRLFREHAGVSPWWVLRRYRLLDAAELVSQGKDLAWAEVASDLGYADQAHLIRDFRAATGQTPAAYAAAQVPRGPTGAD